MFPLNPAKCMFMHVSFVTFLFSVREHKLGRYSRSADLVDGNETGTETEDERPLSAKVQKELDQLKKMSGVGMENNFVEGCLLGRGWVPFFSEWVCSKRTFNCPSFMVNGKQKTSPVLDRFRIVLV